MYTYGYFEVNQYLKCSLICNHVDFKVNFPEKLGRERVNVNADCRTQKINHGELIIEHHYVQA